MLKKVALGAVYLAVFIVSIFVFTWAGYVSGLKIVNRDPASVPAQLNMPAPKPYDPAKPTVAILVGTQSTEVTDFLIPYEIFSAAGAFNVFSAGLQRQLSTLSGGLDVMPDYSLDGLDKMLGKSPDIIVVPNIDESQAAINPSILNWLRGHAATSQLFSICVGARTLAEAGLLNGHRATTHWNYIDAAQQKFPNVNWQRGLRYVDDGTIVSSAGITAGIDASLHIVAQRLGQASAERIANDLHYPDFGFVTNPQAVQYHPEFADNVGPINLLYGSPRADDGVLLYDGVGEIDLAAVFDTYIGSFRTVTDSVAPTRQWMTTKHGLVLLPRYAYDSAPAFERLLVPGQNARQLAVADMAAWTARQNNVPVVTLQADMPNRFAFDALLLDVVGRQDVATAQRQAKFLEYRSTALVFVGASWPWLLTLKPVFVGLAGVLFVFVGTRMLARRRATPFLKRSAI